MLNVFSKKIKVSEKSGGFMTQIKKKLIASLILGFLILPVVVFAQKVDPNEPNIWTPDKAFIFKAMGKLVTYVWQFFAGLTVIMFIYAGVLFVTSSGAPDRITRARMAALWGVVGIVVAVIAYSIVSVVKTLF